MPLNMITIYATSGGIRNDGLNFTLVMAKNFSVVCYCL